MHKNVQKIQHIHNTLETPHYQTWVFIVTMSSWYVFSFILTFTCLPYVPVILSVTLQFFPILFLGVSSVAPLVLYGWASGSPQIWSIRTFAIFVPLSSQNTRPQTHGERNGYVKGRKRKISCPLCPKVTKMVTYLGWYTNNQECYTSPSAFLPIVLLYEVLLIGKKTRKFGTK